MEKIKQKVINGYIALHLPDHLHALMNPKMYGWVYEHRVVAEEFMGRPLAKDEEVHHLDENKMNNHPENLLVLTQSQHQKLHGWMRRMGIDPKQYPTKLCEQCQCVLSKDLDVYCSSECSALGRRKVERPDKEQLEADMLIMSMVKVGEKYGVSDNSVRKWCKQYGIEIKPRFTRFTASGGVSVSVQTQ
ncbi:HNH endonuclease [Pseudomonas phage Psa21]|uniref:HNH endonuclease n=1 Tax=Pseudomonas phage Psa21 TaxID=2530023 RepID=A0A481W510_9CAUD|nr:HNH endonuclease [Pseudomonas phage Psa21]QBJ02936.1 HNH endonuclease [Pseudomonas phage Psa21]